MKITTTQQKLLVFWLVLRAIKEAPSKWGSFFSHRYKEKIRHELVARVFGKEAQESIRSNPLNVEGIVGGKSDDNTLRIFMFDKYGAVHQDDFVVTNYRLYFLFGIYDMLYLKDISFEEAMELIKNCLKVFKEKLVF